MDLSCADIVRYNDKLFILTRDTQCLLEYCPLSGKINLCGAVREKLGQFFVSMALCGDKLYIAPYEAEVFCIYDIKKREFRRISLEKTKKEGKKRRYKICFSYQRKIYFLGGRGTVMLCVDADTDVAEEITDWHDRFRNRYGFDTWVRTHQYVCIVNQCFWVALEGKNILLQYNMMTREYLFWSVGTKEMQYVTVSFDGEFFWLSGENKTIVRWKKETNEIKEFENFPYGFKTNSEKVNWRELFSCGYIWKGNIYFAPLNSNMLVKFDRASEQMKCIVKTNMNDVCFKIVEVSNQEMYMEEDKIENQLLRQAYFINEGDEFRIKSIRIEKEDAIYNKLLIEDMKMKIHDNIIVEAFPHSIISFLGILKEQDISNEHITQSRIGRNILGRLL